MTRNSRSHEAVMGKGTGTLLPVPNATVPYWRSELHELDEYRSTEQLPSECDVAIIGAGMSGVATAYHLLKVSESTSRPSIVLLEARQLCSGATGRNGSVNSVADESADMVQGHVKMKATTLLALRQRFGVEIAEELSAFVSDQIDALKEVVESEGLDCEFELRRSFDVFLGEQQAREVESGFRASVKAGDRWAGPVDYVPKERAELVTSIHEAKGATSSPIASLWPYKFVSQLLSKIIDDVNFQTNTPVMEVLDHQPSGQQVIRTPRGVLQAKTVVFATNAYTGGICKQYKDKIVPYKGTASHLVPHPGPISPHLSHTYNINYTPARVDYLNPRPDGGIVVGGGKWEYEAQPELWYNNWDDSTLLPGPDKHFGALMQRYFRGWENSGSSVESLWTGIMGLTADEQPHVGEVPGHEGRQYVLAGFNGGGNGLIFLSARGVARMIQHGITFKQTGLPGVFQSTAERLMNKPTLALGRRP